MKAEKMYFKSFILKLPFPRPSTITLTKPEWCQKGGQIRKQQEQKQREEPENCIEIRCG